MCSSERRESSTRSWEGKGKYAANSISSLLIYSVWNLANGHEVDETKKQIKKYEKENESLIRKNKLKWVSTLSHGTVFHVEPCVQKCMQYKIGKDLPRASDPPS